MCNHFAKLNVYRISYDGAFDMLDLVVTSPAMTSLRTQSNMQGYHEN